MNCKHYADLRTTDVLCRSLADTAEAIALMSKLCLSRNKQTLNQWVRKMMEHIDMCDLWLTCTAVRSIRSKKIELTLGLLPDNEAEELVDQFSVQEAGSLGEVGLITHLCAVAEKSSVDETSFMALVARFDNFFTTTTWSDLDDGVDIKALVRKINYGHQFRLVIIHFLQCLARLATAGQGLAHRTAEECVADWLAHRARNDLANSYIEKAMALHGVRRTLGKAANGMPAPEGGLHADSGGDYIFVDDDKLDANNLEAHAVMNWSESLEFVLALAGWSSIDVWLKMLDGAGQHVFDKFYGAIHADSIQAGPCFEGKHGAELIQSLLVLPEAQPLNTEAAAIFNASDPTSKRFTASELLELLERFFGKEHGNSGIAQGKSVTFLRTGIFKSLPGIGDDPEASTVVVCVNLVLSVCDIYRWCAVIVGTLAFLFDIMKKAVYYSEQLMIDARLSNMFDTVRNATKIVNDMIGQIISDATTVLGPLRFPLYDVQTFVSNVDSSIESLANAVAEGCLQELLQAGRTKCKALPNYAGYLNETTYRQASVTRYIINNGKCSSWEPDTLAMHYGVHGLTTWTKTQLGKDIANMDNFNEEYEEVLGCLKSVQGMVCALWGAQCVQQWTGEDQYRRARDLLSKDTFAVPKAMNDMLVDLKAKALLAAEPGAHDEAVTASPVSKVTKGRKLPKK